ncbi:sperm-associated antigen 8 [Notamacropus eugenii]|uniref:sperm-associated antigen 8 n=1 Tax=Notamacropus eugenii TaxID=9315 RepID=UPI003B676FF7
MEAIERAGPEGDRVDPGPREGASLMTSAAPDTAPAEAAAFTGEEPMVASQQSSGMLPQGPKCSANSGLVREHGLVCSGFLPQPYLSPMHCCYWKPKSQKQPPWKTLQVPEPGAPGLPWCPESLELQEPQEPQEPRKPLPRGHCLIHNWMEERATNELDEVLNYDESEGFRYRYGHVGLLSLELSPQTSRSTQQDSYQHPGNTRIALRGKREAMLELLLHHQIRKEVDQEMDPPKYFNYESVTHHDYQRELDRPGPPPPTKPHSLQEQPETVWRQRAKKLQGVSNNQTCTPFRKNCTFSTPVCLSMDQPLPYCSGNYPQR